MGNEKPQLELLEKCYLLHHSPDFLKRLVSPKKERSDDFTLLIADFSNPI